MRLKLASGRYGLLHPAFNYSFLGLLLALFGLAAPLCAAPVAKPLLILAYGDSLTAGYQLPAAFSFPAQLQASLRKDGLNVTVHNAGVSGDTTTQGLARMAWVMGGLKTRPDLVILELGANDSLRGIDPKITRRNLDAMLSNFKQRGVPVLLAGMQAPPNMGATYASAFNPIYPQLARQHKVALYPFFLDGVVLRADLKLGDGMHPNQQGVAMIVARIKPAVRKALKM